MLPLPFQASQRTHQTTAFITSLLSNSRNTSPAWICFPGMLHWERLLCHPWHQCSTETNWNEFWRNVCLCQITPYKTCEITAFLWANSLYPLKERETKHSLCSAAFLGLVVNYKTMTTCVTQIAKFIKHHPPAHILHGTMALVQSSLGQMSAKSRPNKPKLNQLQIQSTRIEWAIAQIWAISGYLFHS